MKRREDELFKDYVVRRAAENAATKALKRGTMFWNSSELGTYKKGLKVSRQEKRRLRHENLHA